MSKYEREKSESFIEYVSDFQPTEMEREVGVENEKRPGKVKPAIADTRHGLVS